jgi:hypothetical protein
LQSRHIEIESKLDEDVDFWSPAPIPSVLQVCRESRNFALPLYPLCFGSSWYPPVVRFNLSLDVLYIRDTNALCYFFGTMTPTEVSGLRYIAVEAPTMTILHRTEPGFERALKSLSGLKEVYIVYDLRKEHGRSHCRSVTCTTLCEDVPDGLSSRGQRKVTQQLENDKLLGFPSSSTYECSRVYGVKQCHCTQLESESDMYDVYGSDSDDEIQYFPDGHDMAFPWEDFEGFDYDYDDDDMYDPTEGYF